MEENSIGAISVLIRQLPRIRGRHRSWRELEYSSTVFAVAILLISGLSGLARGAGPQVILLTGLTPLSLAVNQAGTISINITGGVVDASHQYTLYWFFGGTNSTAISSTKQTAFNSSSGCTLHAQCNAKAQTSVQVKYSRPGSYDVSVTVYDGLFGNYSIATDVVTIYDSFQICLKLPNGISPTNVTAKEGQNVTLVAQATPNPWVTYSWDFGDGTSSSGNMTNGGAPCKADLARNIASHSFFHSGVHLITLTISDTYGYSARKFVFVNVTHSYPTVTLSGSASAKRFSPVQFTATPADGNGISSYSWSSLVFVWNFGDGRPNSTSALNGVVGGASVSRVSHTFNTTGNFTVKVWVTDGENPISTFTGTSASVVVSIQPLPPGCSASGLNFLVGRVTPISLTTCATGFTLGPWLNVSWALGGLGTSYGSVGRASSYSYGAESIPVTLRNQSGSTVDVMTASLTFADVPPTVGVTGIYVEPTITLTLVTCSFQSVTLTIWENTNIKVTNATLTGVCSLFSPSYHLTLPTVPLYLGNSYSVQAVYVPLGTTGGTSATLALAYAGNNPIPRSASWTFVNSNPSTFTWNVAIGPLSLGEPVFLRTEMFSPADTSLTTVWNFGDGSQPTTYTSPAPSTLGPSLVYYIVQHSWLSGGNYPLTVTTQDPVANGQGGLQGQDSITIIESGSISATDTAPIPTLSAPPTLVAEGAPGTWMVSAPDVNLGVGVTPPTWQFGDGRSSVGSTVYHSYAYLGAYCMVVYARSSAGSTGVNFSILRVVNLPPTPRVTYLPANPSTNGITLFNASRSTAGLTSANNLTFGWNFGDGSGTAGYGSAGYTVSHIFTAAGNYRVILTVADLVGQSASILMVVHVQTTVLSNATVPAQTVQADRFGSFVVGLPNMPIDLLPFLNATWTWGGGTSPFPSVNWGSFGPATGHTYLRPGSYTQAVRLTAPGVSGYNATAHIVVLDPAPSISLAYREALIYGENHTATLNATGLGSWEDNINPPVKSWNFTWAWGDGTSPSVTPSGTAGVVATHRYNRGGVVSLNVTVISPQLAAYRNSSTQTVQLTLVPDWDGDGLPNVFEKLITKTSPSLTNTRAGIGQAWGTGFTDYLQALFNGLLSNLTGDPDGDGLTSAQEVFGSVTGYVSNPLDANTAGDGIPDGGHFYTDSFAASQVVSFNYSVGTVATTVPFVQYGGAMTGFNQSRLTVEISTVPSYLTSISLVLVVGTPGQGRTINLPTPANITDTYYLLNDSPQAGVSSGYGLTLNDFSTAQNWTLEITTSNPSASGTVPAVTLSNSYYTNPSLADPYHQGMLQGSSITIPVFNCSAPANETYPVLNWVTSSVSNVSYWPYTQSYYKLSRLQGVPYSSGYNATIAAANSPSCSGVIAPGHFGDTANYLGDSDFGLSPWRAYASGDSKLSNGMKALGAANYTATAWYYENSLGQLVSVGGPTPYPVDHVSYQGSLNPTTYDTAGDGIADSRALNPVAPVVLKVTIYSAKDPACEFSILNQILGSYGDNVAAYQLGQPSAETLWTPMNYAPTGGSSTLTCFPPYQVNDTYTFNDHYTLPLNLTAGTNSYKIEFDLFHNQICSPCYTNDSSVVVTGSATNLGVIWTPSGANINASVQVISLVRAPGLLFNTTEELQLLPHYGLRYVGEQKFYALYVNATSALSPFAAGINVVIESRKAFLDSPMNQALQNRTTDTVCFGNANLTLRNATTSQAGLAGTLSLNVTNATCAARLVTALKSLNSTGVAVGRFQALNTSQFELLGLNLQAVRLVPFMAPAGFGDQLGSAPGGSYPFQGVIESAVQFLSEAWLVDVSIWTTVIKAEIALGQLVLGTLHQIALLAQTAFQAAMSGLQLLLQFITAYAAALIGMIVAPLLSGIAAYVFGVNVQMLAIDALHSNGAMTHAEAAALWGSILGTVFVVGVAIAVGLGVLVVLVSGLSLGTSFLITMLAGIVVSALLSQLSNHLNPGGATNRASFSGATFVTMVENVSNGTGHHPSTNNTPGKSVSQKDQWQIFAGLFSLTADLANLPLGIGLMWPLVDPQVAKPTNRELLMAIGGLVLAFVGLAFDINGLSGTGGCITNNPDISTLGTLFGIIGMALSIYGVKSAIPSLRTLSYFSGVLSFLSFGVGLAEGVKACY